MKYITFILTLIHLPICIWAQMTEPCSPALQNTESWAVNSLSEWHLKQLHCFDSLKNLDLNFRLVDSPEMVSYGTYTNWQNSILDTVVKLLPGHINHLNIEIETFGFNEETLEAEIFQRTSNLSISLVNPAGFYFIWDTSGLKKEFANQGALMPGSWHNLRTLKRLQVSTCEYFSVCVTGPTKISVEQFQYLDSLKMLRISIPRPIEFPLNDLSSVSLRRLVIEDLSILNVKGQLGDLPNLKRLQIIESNREFEFEGYHSFNLDISGCSSLQYLEIDDLQNVVSFKRNWLEENTALDTLSLLGAQNLKRLELPPLLPNIDILKVFISEPWSLKEISLSSSSTSRVVSISFYNYDSDGKRLKLRPLLKNLPDGVEFHFVIDDYTLKRYPCISKKLASKPEIGSLRIIENYPAKKYEARTIKRFERVFKEKLIK